MGLREPLRDLTCGLPLALEVMGERWAFMILRAAFNKVSHFEEFHSELGIARNILSNRLGVLVDARDGAPIAPIGIRAADGRDIGWHDLAWRKREG